MTAFANNSGLLHTFNAGVYAGHEAGKLTVKFCQWLFKDKAGNARNIWHMIVPYKMVSIISQMDSSVSVVCIDTHKQDRANTTPRIFCATDPRHEAVFPPLE